MITHKELINTLNYDPLTGIFRRKVKPRIGSIVGGTINPTTGYRYIKIKSTVYVAHRLAWFYMTGSWPKDEIDHINHVRHDNRFSNFREATKQQNVRHRRDTIKTISRVPGVCWHEQGKGWLAHSHLAGPKRYIGFFKGKFEAVCAIKALEAKLENKPLESMEAQS